MSAWNGSCREAVLHVLSSLVLMLHSRTAWLVSMLIGIALVGALGYMVLEGWSFSEVMYMTVIALSTVGFGEVRSLWVEGRAFTTVLIAGGVISVTYMFSTISHTIISGEITGTVRRRRMERVIDR